jgi:S1-C subfamily serine protease
MALWVCLAIVPSAAEEPTKNEAPEARAWMGVFLGDAVDGGVHLVAVVPGGPAARADLRVGDIVVQAGELRLTGVRELSSLLARAQPGVTLRLQLLRSGEALTRAVRLSERPPSTVLVRDIAPSPPRPPEVPPVVPPAALVASRAYGLVLAEVTPDLRRYYGAPAEAGVLVTGIAPGRPAAGDGIRVGDVLVQLDDRPVSRVADVDRVFEAARETALAAALIREGQPRVVTLHSAVAPEPPAGTAETLTPQQELAAGAAVDRALRLEIRRLQERIDALKQRLETLEDDQR